MKQEKNKLPYCSEKRLNNILSKVSEDELYKLYIEEDLDRKDVCKEFNITSHELCVLLSYFNIKKDMSMRMKKTRKRQLANMTSEKARRIKQKELLTKSLKSDEEKKKIKEKELATKMFLKENNPEEYYRIQNTRNKTHSKTLKNKDKSFWENRYKKFLPSITEAKEASVKKCIETKRKNNSFNKSKQENFIVDYFKKYYNIKTQYKCEKYPFCCDIYLPDLDIFIEINAHWTHGRHPFDFESKSDLKELEKIRSHQKYYKTKSGSLKKNMYFVFEDVWTKYDVDKLRYAKNNNLTYIALYNVNNYNVKNIEKLNVYNFKNTGINIIDISKL